MRLRATPPDAAKRGRGRQHPGRGPHFRRARNPGGAGPRGGSSGRGFHAGPRPRGRGLGPTGTRRPGLGSRDPSDGTSEAPRACPARCRDRAPPACPPARERRSRPGRRTKPPRSSRAPPRARARRPLTGGSTAALALPPAPSDERRPPPAAPTVTSGVTRLPLSRAGPPCACAGRGRRSARSPFCGGPRGRVPRGPAASRQAPSVRCLCLRDEGRVLQSGGAGPPWPPGLRRSCARALSHCPRLHRGGRLAPGTGRVRSAVCRKEGPDLAEGLPVVRWWQQLQFPLKVQFLLPRPSTP